MLSYGPARRRVVKKKKKMVPFLFLSKLSHSRVLYNALEQSAGPSARRPYRRIFNERYAINSFVISRLKSTIIKGDKDEEEEAEEGRWWAASWSCGRIASAEVPVAAEVGAPANWAAARRPRTFSGRPGPSAPGLRDLTAPSKARPRLTLGPLACHPSRRCTPASAIPAADPWASPITVSIETLSFIFSLKFGFLQLKYLTVIRSFVALSSFCYFHVKKLEITFGLLLQEFEFHILGHNLLFLNIIVSLSGL